MTVDVAYAAAAIVFAAALVAAGLWLSRRLDASFDRHVEQALAMARHPSARHRPCACGDPGSLRAHSPLRCQAICACRRLQPDREPMIHDWFACWPSREVVS